MIIASSLPGMSNWPSRATCFVKGIMISDLHTVKTWSSGLSSHELEPGNIQLRKDLLAPVLQRKWVHGPLQKVILLGCTVLICVDHWFCWGLEDAGGVFPKPFLGNYGTMGNEFVCVCMCVTIISTMRQSTLYEITRSGEDTMHPH